MQATSLPFGIIVSPRAEISAARFWIRSSSPGA